MEDTADAAGDSADQLEGFSERFAGAMTAAVAALAVGAAGLLSQVPVLSETFAGLAAIVDAVTFQMDSVLRPAMSGVTDTLFEIANAVFEMDGSMGQLVGTLATVASGAGIVVGALFALGVALTGPILAAIGAVAAAIALLWTAWQTNFGNIRGFALETFNRIMSRIQRFVSVVRPIVNNFLAALSAFWEQHGDTIMSVVRFALRTSLAIITTLLDTILTIVQTTLQLLSGDWEGAWNSITNFLRRQAGLWGPLLSDAAGALRDVLTNLAADIVSWAGDLADSAFAWGKNLIQQFINGIKSVISNLRDSLSDLRDIGATVGVDVPDLDGFGGGGGGGSGINTDSATRRRPGGRFTSTGGTRIDGRQLTESTGRYRSDPGRRRGL